MEVRRLLQSQFVETETAKETVLFSNTPSFLFDRLQKDTSASYVAHQLKADEIIDLLHEKCANPKNPMDLLWIYVLIAGLSLKSADEIMRLRNDLNRLDFSRVEWGDYLRAAILNKGPHTNVVEINYQQSNQQEYKTRTNVAVGQTVNSGRS
jgi:hypothetical protein